MTGAEAKPVAVVAGVGSGTGEALVRRLNNSYFSWMGEVIGIRAHCSMQVINGSEDSQAILQRTDNPEGSIIRTRVVTDTSRTFV